MNAPRLVAARMCDVAFFAVFLVYVSAGIDPRLIGHAQAPIFSTIPGFFTAYWRYPGGPAEGLYALIAQAYTSQAWGAIALTAQVAAVSALTQKYFTALAGRALSWVRFIPAALLLGYLNLYDNHMPMVLALLLGLALALLFVHLARRCRSEVVLGAAFVAMLGAAYYLGGPALVFFAPAAAGAHSVRWRRFPLWIAYLLLAAALPVATGPTAARNWFTSADIRQVVLGGCLYAFYAVGVVAVLVRRRSEPRAAAVPPERPRRSRGRTLLGALAYTLPLLLLCAVAGASYQLSAGDRRQAVFDYLSDSEDWPAVIEASRNLPYESFNPLTRYEVNLALYEMNRLGDDVFRFPQADSMLPGLQAVGSLPYMIKITDLCLRLGRVNEAEHFGSEAMILGKSDPRVCRLMARVNMVKGQTAAARKYLTVLSYDLGSSSWARQRLEELDRDPQLASDPQVQSLRRRMLRNDDMLPVWQRADRPDADMERILLDQLEQDPTNRMAFEFLACSYMLARDLKGVKALMPRIKDMTGPAYVGPGGSRRTPRYFQEAMAVYTGFTNTSVTIEGFTIQPETFLRMGAFRRLMMQAATKEGAMQAAWNDFRDTYFYYYTFGPGDYR